jgi:hypothetical protein
MPIRQSNVHGMDPKAPLFSSPNARETAWLLITTRIQCRALALSVVCTASVCSASRWRLLDRKPCPDLRCHFLWAGGSVLDPVVPRRLYDLSDGLLLAS